MLGGSFLGQVWVNWKSVAPWGLGDMEQRDVNKIQNSELGAQNTNFGEGSP